eukprot:7563383-Pyramimonas_sp.AAC.1
MSHLRTFLLRFHIPTKESKSLRYFNGGGTNERTNGGSGPRQHVRREKRSAPCCCAVGQPLHRLDVLAP